MAWNPESVWQPAGWQPPGWHPEDSQPAPASIKVAFLDRYGRFCKDPRDLFEIRIFETVDASVYTSITVAEYRALPRARQEELQLADSAAGLIDTSDKSNA